MLTLGIETSGKSGSVALWVDGKSLEERALDPSGRRHARSLVAEIAEGRLAFHSFVFQASGKKQFQKPVFLVGGWGRGFASPQEL